MDRDASERALCFGPDARLVGLLNHRRGDAPAAVLLLNVGVTHRIGPRRVNVRLARALGEAGVASLRFDLSGIGDSRLGDLPGDHRERAAADIAAAMDAVERSTGIARFVMAGICSGAVNGYRATLVDPRVVGLLMFDGYAYATLQTQLRHDWTRLRTMPLRQVVAKVTGRCRALLGLPIPNRTVSIFDAVEDVDTPDRAAYAAALDALAARGVRLFVAYSGSMLAHHNHRAQYRSRFRGRRFLESVEYHFLPHIDHVVTTQAAQAEFVALVRRWVVGVVGETPSLVFDDARRPAPPP